MKKSADRSVPSRLGYDLSSLKHVTEPRAKQVVSGPFFHTLARGTNQAVRDLVSSNLAKGRCAKLVLMCRSIKVLRKPGEPTTADEFNAAALQFVRKISGFRKPSKANQESFERAVAEVADASRRLLESLGRRADSA